MSTALLVAVSHDVRNPLAALRLAVDGLRSQGVADGERLELLEVAAASAQQVERLLEDLLDLSRLETRTGLTLRACSLDEVLRLAVEGHSPSEVSLELEDPSPVVSTDARLLERVVANLVSNAIRHSCGSPVRVQAVALPGAVEIAVIDHGPGVPPGRRAQVFEPFRRLDETTGQGLGLGLTVARELTKAVNGTLTAAETPGGGLTMVVSLPR